jgi:hypothetical protein
LKSFMNGILPLAFWLEQRNEWLSCRNGKYPVFQIVFPFKAAIISKEAQQKGPQTS